MSKAPITAQRRDKADVFSLAFLDIISCGFGAVVVLILIFKFDPFPDDTATPTQQTDNAAAFAKIVAEAELSKNTAEEKTTLEQLASARAANDSSFQDLQQRLEKLRKKLAIAEASNTEKQQQLAALQNQIEQVTVAGATTTAPADRDEEAGGILVDRDYVIFIVDTSGSMREIWGRVADRMTVLLEQHPRVKGIQVMNDSGSYLISAYAKRWITDTPKMRERILKIFNLWSAASNSSPAEGLERALIDFQSSTQNMSIYVLGDDYSGGDFDGVIETVRRLNTGGARINAINFINPSASTDRFSILMREITFDNNGTLITM